MMRAQDSFAEASENAMDIPAELGYDEPGNKPQPADAARAFPKQEASIRFRTNLRSMPYEYKRRNHQQHLQPVR